MYTPAQVALKDAGDSTCKVNEIIPIFDGNCYLKVKG